MHRLSICTLPYMQSYLLKDEFGYTEVHPMQGIGLAEP